jgi:hypothetical protein
MEAAGTQVPTLMVAPLRLERRRIFLQGALDEPARVDLVDVHAPNKKPVFELERQVVMKFPLFERIERLYLLGNKIRIKGTVVQASQILPRADPLASRNENLPVEQNLSLRDGSVLDEVSELVLEVRLFKGDSDHVGDLLGHRHDHVVAILDDDVGPLLQDVRRDERNEADDSMEVALRQFIDSDDDIDRFENDPDAVDVEVGACGDGCRSIAPLLCVRFAKRV